MLPPLLEEAGVDGRGRCQEGREHGGNDGLDDLQYCDERRGVRWEGLGGGEVAAGAEAEGGAPDGE